LNHTERSDQEIVELALKGRESAYRELLRRYERPVLSLIFRIVRDRELAEDLAQDTFVKVLNALDRYKPEFKFSSWIFKIAHNTALDALRRKEVPTLSLDGAPDAVSDAAQAATRPVVVSDEESPVEFTAGRELGVHIERAIARLRPEYRTAVTLYHIEGFAYEEIAETMELPLGTVKTFIHRARKELREHLEHLRASA
jgi:RNA polymerase sigma-70 factor (ECF subfamily)